MVTVAVEMGLEKVTALAGDLSLNILCMNGNKVANFTTQCIFCLSGTHLSVDHKTRPDAAACAGAGHTHFYLNYAITLGSY